MLIVEPSGFRTDWARSASEVRHPIADYDTTALRARIATAREASTPQAGNPTRAAAAIIRDVAAAGPNLHLPLGAGSVAATLAKLATLTAEYHQLSDIAHSVDD